MERDRAVKFASKEREEEEEEMKKELLNMQMYEPGYSYNYMNLVLRAVNESKDMANEANSNKNAQKELLLESSNDHFQGAMTKTNLAQDSKIQEHKETNQSIHSYRSKVTCSSPALTSNITDSRSTVHGEKNMDNENIFFKLQDNLSTRDSSTHNTNTFTSLTSKNCLQMSDTKDDTEIKTNAIPECNQKLETWQINPLDACVSENDVPLKEPDRPISKGCMPFALYKDAQTPEMLEKLLPELTLHLKETAALWHGWHRTANIKCRWGSPIQVEGPESNSDMALTNMEMECTSKHHSERPNKRKSASFLFSSNLSYSSSDEDESMVKKKKIKSYKGNSAVTHSEMDSEFKSHCDNINKPLYDVDMQDRKLKYKTKENLLNELHSASRENVTFLNVKETINEEREYVINESRNSPLAHSSKEIQNTTMSKQKKNTFVNDNDFMELKDFNDKIGKTLTENIEIKPLPIKGLSRRIKNEIMVLEKIQLEKQRKILTEQEEVQEIENEERRKREEFYKKQMEDRQKAEKLREEREKCREEKSKKWKNIAHIKSQKKASKDEQKILQGLYKQCQNKAVETMNENRAACEESSMEIMSNDTKVHCPICNKPFSSDKIEAHAAVCEQYTIENEYENDLHLFKGQSSSVNVNSTEILECGVCSKYRTTNGIHYEDHVNSCLQKQQQKESIDEYSSIEMNSILNSPVRCYRPISEQNNSNIDYRKQFPSNSKTQVHLNKKRKR